MSIIYNLNVRCYEILEHLLYKDGYTTIQQIADEKSISKRSAYYDIRKINEWLEAQQMPPLEIERKKGILIGKKQKTKIRKRLKEIPLKLAYIFSPEERMKIIICSVLLRSRNLHIDDFMDLCQVSRNTIIKDLKVASDEIAKFQLYLCYDNKKGYHIVGDLVKKRSIYFLYFSSIADFYKKGILPVENPEKVQEILGKLKNIEEALDIQYVTGILYSIAVFFSTIESRTETMEFTEGQKQEIIQTKEFMLVQEYFCELEEGELLYLTLHLLGSRVQSISADIMNGTDGQEIHKLSMILVRAFSRIACVSFDREDELIQAITSHLKTSLYRYHYGIQLENPMLDDIKNEYGDLFEITSQACKELEREIEAPIPEGEVAYLALHFGAFINSGTHTEEEKLNILVVCPNGLSTANMIREEIYTLVPNAESVDMISMKEYRKDHGYSMVISTMVIENEENLIMVHPILTDNDRISILKKCMKYENQGSLNVYQITEIAKKYMEEEDLLKFKKELTDYCSHLILETYRKKNHYGDGICQTMKSSNIQIISQQMDWKEAIYTASESLVKDGSIEESYVESMIQKTKKYGPYMFITKHVVLAHSEIEAGANLLGIAFTIFRHPVTFWTQDQKERKAKIILVLSTQDQTRHIKILNEIMTIFKDEENTERICKCRSVKEVQEVIYHMLQEGS